MGLEALEGTLWVVFMLMTVVTEVTVASEVTTAATAMELLDLPMLVQVWMDKGAILQCLD